MDTGTTWQPATCKAAVGVFTSSPFVGPRGNQLADHAAPPTCAGEVKTLARTPGLTPQERRRPIRSFFIFTALQCYCLCYNTFTLGGVAV